jgi:hypothetical protein
MGTDGEGMISDNDLNWSGSVCWMSLIYEKNWGLFRVSYLFFTRAVYRVFILWCEYPTRLFLFRTYKGNEKMGIRKIMT